MATAALARIVNASPVVTDDLRVELGLSLAAPPRRSQELGRPDEFAIGLSALGAVTLRWRCANPQRGVMYTVSRSVGGTDGGAFEHLGVTGERRFVDETIPRGATAIDYEVRAVRLKRAGEPARFRVNFGTNGQNFGTNGRQRPRSIEPSTPATLAA